MTKTKLLLTATTLCCAALAANATTYTWEPTTGTTGWNLGFGDSARNWNVGNSAGNWTAVFSGNATGNRIATQAYAPGDLRLGGLYVSVNDAFTTTVTASANNNTRDLMFTSNNSTFNLANPDGDGYNFGTIANTGSGTGTLYIGGAGTGRVMNIGVAANGDSERYLQMNAGNKIELTNGIIGAANAKITELNITGAGGVTLKTANALNNLNKVSITNGNLDVSAAGTINNTTNVALDNGTINAGANDLKITSLSGTSTVNGTGAIDLSTATVDVTVGGDPASVGVVFNSGVAATLALGNVDVRLGSLQEATYTLLSGTNLLFSGDELGGALTGHKIGDTWTANGWDFVLSQNGSSIQLGVSAAIPEPSTYALIGGVAALGVALVARRRAKR